MKEPAIITLILLSLFTQSSKAQIDTLAVMQNIVNNKSQYIGQPFSLLYNQLPIQIKYYFFPSTSPARDVALLIKRQPYNKNSTFISCP